ncbi:MAG: chemotaxis protein CheW [Sulfuricella denitrificans]|nr:chemotaxis protein CheW [Sulfuricella denitrificans]
MGKENKGRTDKVSAMKPVFEEALAFAQETAPGAKTPSPGTPHARPSAAGLPPAIAPAVGAVQLMPRDENVQEVLRSRARLLARLQKTGVVEEARDQYLCFRLGPNELYGIPYACLEELMYVGSIARVPGTPRAIAGVVNRRGELLSVLDLRQFFRTDAHEDASQARIIVVQADGARVGLLVDAVEGNEFYVPARVAAPLSSDGVSNIEYVQGIYEGKVTLLNIRAMLADPGLVVNRSAA